MEAASPAWRPVFRRVFFLPCPQALEAGDFYVNQWHQCGRPKDGMGSSPKRLRPLKLGMWNPVVCFLGLAVACLQVWSRPASAQEPAQNVILITLDGLRGEEVFGGADERLLIPELADKNVETWKRRYGGDSAQQRRRKLMPFLWSQVTNGGWIAGSLDHDSRVEVTNGKYFSYPGYNELLCGFADDKVDSNAKKYNENVTVLEWLNRQPKLKGKVAAYCSWDVFPFIIHDVRSQIPVNAGWSKLTVGEPRTLDALNHVADNLFHEWAGVRYDVFTASGALQALKTHKPRVLYVSLGETDDWAHAGRYDRYLLAAEQNDRFIRQLWNATEKDPQYQGKTAFFISTDHGRGTGREGWKNHSNQLPGSERIWIAAFGAGLSAHGIDEGGSYQQAQIAATVAQFLGYDFRTSDAKIAEALPIVR